MSKVKEDIRQARIGDVAGKNVAQGPRRIEELIAKGVDLDKVAKTLTAEEIERLVDRGYDQDQIMKDAKAEVEPIKKLLLANAKNGEWKTRTGQNALCSIGKSTSTIIQPTVLLGKLREIGKKHLFDTVFKVAIQPVKDYVGLDSIKEIVEYETEEYGKVTLKKL